MTAKGQNRKQAIFIMGFCLAPIPAIRRMTIGRLKSTEAVEKHVM